MQTKPQGHRPQARNFEGKLGRRPKAAGHRLLPGRVAGHRPQARSFEVAGHWPEEAEVRRPKAPT